RTKINSNHSECHHHDYAQAKFYFARENLATPSFQQIRAPPPSCINNYTLIILFTLSTFNYYG
ncbi:MAG: hypothetical protein MJE68_10060, partial [Proteobacteria bacterium]|nr:hypothetical protein [Pseudomonadota bacterium]